MSSSREITRLVRRLIAATEPKALSLGAMTGLLEALAAVESSDSMALGDVSNLKDFKARLLKAEEAAKWAKLKATPGQIDINGEEVTA